MNTKFRAVVMTAVVAVFASTLALPVSAEANGAAIIQGTAFVGKWFVDDCDKSGLATVTGRGLYHPGTQRVQGVSNGADTREEDGVWQFSSTGNAVPQGGFEIDTCGWLGPVVDLDEDRGTAAGLGGATCGNSKGHHGQGRVDFANAEVNDLKLYDIGWKISALGTLLINGRYQEYGAGGPAKNEKYGLVTGVAQVQGGLACLGLKAINDGNGAQNYTVVGVIDLANTGATEPADPKDQLPETTQDKKCKGSGASAGRDGVKKSHDNKPAHDTECDGGDK